MGSKIKAGALAGLAAGLVFGSLMQMMSAPTPSGGHMPMMAMVAKIVHSNSLIVGWLYHLFNSVLIGAFFGWLFDEHIQGYSDGLAWGAVYGVFWWILGALILMPIFLGMSAFAPLKMAPMRMVAMASLMGHVIYGLVLGIGFTYCVLGASCTRVICKEVRESPSCRRI